MMPDPLTTGAIVAAASKKGEAESPGGYKWLAHLFGPAADEVGEALRRFTAHRLGNVQKITERAEKKAAGQPEGSIPLRVAHQILEEGSYSDDDVVVEYLSGVLASARTPDGRDDQAVPWTALVSRLSSDQLRLHYILYSTCRHLLLDEQKHLDDICKSHIFVPYSSLLPSLGIEDPEQEFGRFMGSFYGLSRESLVGDDYHFGPGEILIGAGYPTVSEPGLIYTPSRHGIILYLWGHGLGHYAPEALIMGEADIQTDPQLVQIRFEEAKVVERFVNSFLPWGANSVYPSPSAGDN